MYDLCRIEQSLFLQENAFVRTKHRTEISIEGKKRLSLGMNLFIPFVSEKEFKV